MVAWVPLVLKANVPAFSGGSVLLVCMFTLSSGWPVSPAHTVWPDAWLTAMLSAVMGCGVKRLTVASKPSAV